MTAGLVLGSNERSDALLMARVIPVSAGSQACALTPTSGVQCWGANPDGELGNGSTAPSPTPTDVSGLASGVTALAPGIGAHSCALISGGLQCWGPNNEGQLGDGSKTTRLAPVSVVGLSSNVVSVARGLEHTCAVTDTGAAECWGDNAHGELGDGTTTSRSAPVPVEGLPPVSVLAAGGFFTCALTLTGAVKCWGMAAQLGNGANGGDSSLPVDVDGLTSGVVDLSVGLDHACAVTAVGQVECWGSNGAGDLGDGTTTNALSPVTAAGLPTDVTQVSAGDDHTCALTAEGAVFCWGNNVHGQLGDGTEVSRPTAVALTGLASGVSYVTAGAEFSCAFMAVGTIKCWGDDDSGQLGDLAAGAPPTRVTGLSATTIDASLFHTCSVEASGGAACWGYGGNGELGDGSHTTSSSPVEVSGLPGSVSAISAGYQHTCAIAGLSVPLCWGNDSYGALGSGVLTSSVTPVPVSGFPNGASAIDAGFFYTCGITTLGGAKCWGWNRDGQLGDGTTTDRVAATDVVGLTSGVSAIATSDSFTHTCALTNNGAVKCWGSNNSGDIGNGTSGTPPALTPVDVNGLSSGVTAIAVGGETSCALTSEGAVECWGDHFGSTPQVVGGLSSGVASIALGTNHGCAVTTSEAVKCWGSNIGGELGDGTLTDSWSAVDVVGLASGSVAVTAGQSYSCALSSSGAAECWGQPGPALGNDRGITPVDVVGTFLGADISGPTITFATPVQDATYQVGSAVAAAFSCSDPSGVASCVGSTAEGADLPMSLGVHQFTVTALDDVGNSSERAVSYNAVDAVEQVVPDGGGTVATSSPPTADDPVQTAISIPTSGMVDITEGATTTVPPVGYALAAQQVNITAPPSTPDQPLALRFSLDASALAAVGVDATTVQVLRDGLPVGDCVDPSQLVASPDPCVFERNALAGGIAEVGVYSSHASTWNFAAAMAVPPGPAASVGDASVLEGDSGTRTLKFPVTLSQPATTTVSVHYVVAGLTATGAKTFGNGVDFNDRGGKPGTLTFKPSSATGLTPVEAFVSVKVYGDTTPELDKTLKVTLSAPSTGLTIARSQGTGTIVNDDGITGTPTLGIGDALIVRTSSGKAKLTFPITVSTLGGAVSATYAIGLGTGTTYSRKATGGDIGGKLTGTVSIRAGTTGTTLSIPIWSASLLTGVKTFTITLSNVNASGVTMIRATGTGEIISP
jgi:alpha-tubulin suppressor-like RCC1 family protein